MKRHFTALLAFILFSPVAFAQSKKEQKLAEARAAVLYTTYYKAAFDRQQLQTIIPAADSSIDVNSAYQALYSDDKTKFVAFFLKKAGAQSFKSLVESKKDKDIRISVGDNEMKNGLPDIPRYYAYIVKGIKYSNEWIYKKNYVTYFDANSDDSARLEFFNDLQTWNFFKEKSTAFNPDFWETMLFKKVTDISKEKYHADLDFVWKSEEIANRPYIGQYQMIAEKFKDEERAAYDKKENAFVTQYVAPFVEKLKQQGDYETITAKYKPGEYWLIYPTDFKMIICPLKVKAKDKAEFIRYFIWLQQDDRSYKLYEWHYLNPADFKNYASGPSVTTQINTLTLWSTSVYKIDDPKFWNTYVLPQQNGTYTYLTEIKQGN